MGAMVKRFREDPNGDESALGLCTAGKWVRGTSTLPKVFDQPNGSKLELVWKGRQPMGPRKHPSLFSESLGVLMAMSRRFDWTKNWELQDVGDKEWLWDNIKDIWELDETRKEPTLGLISRDEFKNKKSKWKRNFYTRYATYEERISHRPQQLSQQEWVQLVEFWDTPEHQAISKRNRANRAKQIAKHAVGRISFPQFEEIMSQKAGAPPSLGDPFVRTHTSSQTHDALDDQSREYIHKMKDLEGIDEHGTQLPLLDEIYRKVMPPERHGRVSQLTEILRVAQKKEERRLEIEEIKRQALEKDEQRRHEIDEMKRQLDARDADMEARLMKKVANFSQMVSRSLGNGLELKIKYLQL
ncbi:hypothetical protein IFM89_011123 [Coptis chinensis]|uniref:Uncharacterized protein n=1 Tax=Coptis chinensis TaxID=261450 RepID=A0A835LRA9_9MAGN|nr:hypothetical protein IFM89_011123 [Coptis chinensis]